MDDAQEGERFSFVAHCVWQLGVVVGFIVASSFGAREVPYLLLLAGLGCLALALLLPRTVYAVDVYPDGTLIFCFLWREIVTTAGSVTRVKFRSGGEAGGGFRIETPDGGGLVPANKTGRELVAEIKAKNPALVVNGYTLR